MVKAVLLILIVASLCLSTTTATSEIPDRAIDFSDGLERMKRNLPRKVLINAEAEMPSDTDAVDSESQSTNGG